MGEGTGKGWGGQGKPPHKSRGDGGLFLGDKETKKIKGESDSLLGQGSS